MINSADAAGQSGNTVALLQMVSTDSVADNLQQAEVLLADAARQGAVMAVLPENFALLDTANLRSLAETGLDHVVQFLCRQAVEKGLWIVAGSLPMATTSQGDEVSAPHVRSVCLVIDTLGHIRARYDKIHLFDVDVADAQGCYRESDSVEAGNELVVVDTPLGRLGLTICYDLRFPEQYQRLRDAGADMIVVPSAFTYVTGEAHWEVLLRARAVENQVYMLGVNQGGEHSPSRQTWGHSMVVDPWGRMVAACEMGVGVVTTTIDLDAQADLRKKMPVQEHRHRSGF
ncbi:carbon-nitrogen hydrolase family protein [Pontibacterium granulatum]|uniref:carbon-nitrogen hydrolase family protein n=1 Tax=Pontibacterium granulatum TaxID=2036029 RepID=UPI00249CB432|nr:carbon-nitrogen hydrolase family protein [Pontibacterium granulatum]MDI3323195.1 carbon-nitrogen hydrolase family protein [Pontibacterium granulatum]